jgi:H+/Cl- antiporter ClcA
VLIFHNTRLFAGVNIVPGGYAIVGASALVGATTYTLSPAIIMLEITGQLQFLLPLLVTLPHYH